MAKPKLEALLNGLGMQERTHGILTTQLERLEQVGRGLPIPVDQGMSVENLISSFPAAPWTTTLQQDNSGNLTLSEAGDLMTYFAPDLPVRQARVLSAEQGATFAGTLYEPVSQSASQPGGVALEAVVVRAGRE
jgi:hypothetical protein